VDVFFWNTVYIVDNMAYYPPALKESKSIERKAKIIYLKYYKCNMQMRTVYMYTISGVLCAVSGKVEVYDCKALKWQNVVSK